MRKILCVYNEAPSGAATIHQRRRSGWQVNDLPALFFIPLASRIWDFRPLYSLHQPTVSRNASTSALSSCVVYT